jgi:hypothetical protein
MNGRIFRFRLSGTVRLAAIALALVALGAAVWGQSAVLKVPAELARELEKLGWSGEALAGLDGQAVDWSQFRSRDALVLARALRYAVSHDEGIGSMEQVQVAAQVCSMIRTMESLGYGERAIAGAVFGGVRASIQEMSAWRAGGGDVAELQQRIRERLRLELKVQSAAQTKAQVRERVQGGTGSGAERPVIGPGPQGAPGRG